MSQRIPSESVIRKIRVARYLFNLAESHINDSSELSVFAGAHLLQDAAELFLVAALEHLDVPINVQTKFETLIDLIETKVGTPLPYRGHMNRLNRIRIDSKHHGGEPPKDECKRLLVPVKAFFEDVSASHLGINFTTLSLVDLLQESLETTKHLKAAEAALERGDYEECLIECRKTIFLEFEVAFDLGPHLENRTGKGLAGIGLHLIGRGYAVPFYTRQKEFIDKEVKNPTDLIQIDHDYMERNLLTNGVDRHAFWNAHRLTPAVYNDGSANSPWFIRREFALVQGESIKANAEYVFPATVEMMLAVHRSREKTKSKNFSASFAINLAHDEVPIYEKADKTSKVMGHTPKGMNRIKTDFSVDGLDGDTYFSVSAVIEDPRQWLFGYVNNSDITWDEI